MRQDVADAALRFAAERSARTSRLGEERIGDRAVRKHRLVDYLEQAIAHGENFAIA